MPTLPVSKSLKVIDDDGVITDISRTLYIDQAMKLYPLVKAAEQELRRLIEMDMTMSGSKERIVPGVKYEYKETEEWEVKNPVHLRNQLMEVVPVDGSGIKFEEVEQAIQITVTGKANNTALNSLSKRSAMVREIIAAARTRVPVPPRLRFTTTTQRELEKPNGS